MLYFCERVYNKLLTEIEDINFSKSIEQVQSYFTSEINIILEEERINFVFTNGLFSRRGKVQTRKAIERGGYVLADDRFEKARNYFNEALNFYNLKPNPDVENCVKDALCALEATIEILTQKEASKDFSKVINQLKGNGTRQIPAPIADSMFKLYSYRGSAEGVGHASINGNRVNQVDAEFVLSATAVYITYLVETFPFIEDVPF